MSALARVVQITAIVAIIRRLMTQTVCATMTATRVIIVNGRLAMTAAFARMVALASKALLT